MASEPATPNDGLDADPSGAARPAVQDVPRTRSGHAVFVETSRWRNRLRRLSIEAVANAQGGKRVYRRGHRSKPWSWPLLSQVAVTANRSPDTGNLRDDVKQTSKTHARLSSIRWPDRSFPDFSP